MRTSIYFKLMLLALPIATACSNQDEAETTAANPSTLQINVKGCLTRSVITTSSLDENSQLGVFVADKSNSVNYSNVRGVIKGDYCLLDQTIALNEEPRYVYAYYPYSTGYSDATAITYDATSQTDFLIGYSDDGHGILDYVDSTEPTANLLLSHALARVTLNVKKSADNNNDGYVTRVALDNVSTSGTANLLQHASTGSTLLGSISISTSSTLSSTDETTFDLLVAPTASLDSTNLQMTIDGSTYSVAIPTTRATEWEAGKQYVYSVEVGESSNVKINNTDITLWNNNMQSEITITRALEVSTSISGTRSVVTGSSFAEGDEIGLFAYNASGEVYDSVNVCSNVKTTLTSSKWQCSPKIALTNKKAYIYGYYPYDANATFSNNSIKVDINPDWKLGQRDFMYCGCTEADYTSYKPNLTFKHALSRITLAIKKSSTDSGNGNITSIELSNGETNGTKGTELSEVGWMNLATGEVTRIENADDKLSISLNETISSSSTTYIELLVLPNQSSSSPRTASPVVCTLTIDGAAHTFTIDNPQWYAGEQYTYPITLSRK